MTSTSGTIKKTYLRYECADTFSLSCDVLSSCSSSQILSCLEQPYPSNSIIRNSSTTSTRAAAAAPPIVFTVCKSNCVGFHLRRAGDGVPYVKIGHRDPSTVGTGRALNSDESTCIQVFGSSTVNNNNNTLLRIATGWMEGSIRIFTINKEDVLKKGSGVVHSLLQPTDNNSNDADDEFVMRDPLVFKGHYGSPVTCLSLDRSTGARLASGGSDGSVVVWDLIAETGLFRLRGHKRPITHLSFIPLSSSFDGLISSSMDGLVKIWDLDGQCCTQTITNHRSEVWSADTIVIIDDEDNENIDDVDTVIPNNKNHRWRLITGSSDIQLRVWDLRPPTRTATTMITSTASSEVAVQEKEGQLLMDEQEHQQEPKIDDNDISEDSVAVYMGSIHRQTNERVSLVKFHSSGKLFGVLAHGSKQVEIYSVRSIQDSHKRRKRRLRRRREKKESATTMDDIATKNNSKKKRGILDDDDDVGDTNKTDSQYDNEINDENNEGNYDSAVPPDAIKPSDEIQLLGIVQGSQKVKSFTFSLGLERGNTVARIILALTTNALEIHSISLSTSIIVEGESITKRVTIFDMYGHPTGIRSISLSSDERMACTISKGTMKVWNIPNRSCIRSLPLVQQLLDNSNNKKRDVYGLCCSFLPGNVHVVIGTREGTLQIIDFPSGDVVFEEQAAHNGAIWSLDLRSDGEALVTGSADHNVKFWDVVMNSSNNRPSLTLSRVMKMNDDVVAVRYSYNQNPSKRLVAVSTLDSTVKVFFDDSLKFFLSLYGHKLPALAMDCSDDDAIIATAGADKCIKIWGLDFGDTHRTLYGHTDSITDLKFVRRTHYFFTCSKDKTVRYWDGDRFEQILLLSGHAAEVTTLALSKTGAFLLSAGMDRQVRVWERTKDIVFVEEEKERELEKMFEKVDGSQGETSLQRRMGNAEADEQDGIDVSADDILNNEPQSEAAVRRSVLSIAGGDRIAEAIELADQEIKDGYGRSTRQSNNPLLLGLDPPKYILWVLRTIKSAELEQSLLTLPMSHTERLMYYLVVLLQRGIGVEICSNAAIFLIKVHQNQIVSNQSLGTPLRELQRLIKHRINQNRDMIGYNLAALRAVARICNERKPITVVEEKNLNNIWSGMGLGSDIAAALERKKGNKKRQKV